MPLEGEIGGRGGLMWARTEGFRVLVLTKKEPGKGVG